MFRPRHGLDVGAVHIRESTPTKPNQELTTEVGDIPFVPIQSLDSEAELKVDTTNLLPIPELGSELIAIDLVSTEEALSMNDLSEAAQAFLRRYGQLTKREREIASLLVQGRTARQIGTQLCNSWRTVATHRQAINNKLEIRNQLTLLQLSIAAGLIDRKADDGSLHRRLATLTIRERETLLLSFQHQRLEDVAATVHITYKTAKTHLERAYQKLEVSGRVMALHQLYTAGLVDADLHWTDVRQP